MDHAHLVDELVARVLGKLHGPRLVVAVAGVPGSGKLTVVELMVGELARRHVTAAALPQDGFHYYRHELERFPDPAEARRRRGAPFTFNSGQFVQTVLSLRSGLTVRAPLFDHALKDPVPDDIVIPAETQVVFVEGNYVGLAEEPWCQIGQVADELWMVTVPEAVVHGRLVARHLASGVCSTEAEAVERAGGLDWQNALYVMARLRAPDVEITLGAH